MLLPQFSLPNLPVGAKHEQGATGRSRRWDSNRSRSRSWGGNMSRSRRWEGSRSTIRVWEGNRSKSMR